MPPRSGIAFALLLGVLASGASTIAEGAAFTPVSQLRQVQSDTVDATTGYTCLDGSGGGPPLPACPVDLGTTTPSDSHAAPGFSPFSATAATPGGNATQTSSIAATVVRASGDSSATATASEIVDPTYLLVLRTVDPSTSDDFQVSVSLDEASPFVFQASGQIEYPDPAFPIGWDAALNVTLTGPSGEIASFQALPDYGCVSNPQFLCTVAPTPVFLTGTLAPGTYDVSVQLTTSAAGSWLPSTGPLAGDADGSYAVELRLGTASSLPALGPTGLALLFAAIASLARVSPVLGSSRNR